VFTSSNLKFVLTNLGVANLVFVGGHTGASPGKTARVAKRLGWRTLCIEAATFDARGSSRVRRIGETGFDYVLTTEGFLTLLQRASQNNLKPEEEPPPHSSGNLRALHRGRLHASRHSRSCQHSQTITRLASRSGSLTSIQTVLITREPVERQAGAHKS